jgi:hypothetical protein
MDVNEKGKVRMEEVLRRAERVFQDQANVCGVTYMRKFLTTNDSNTAVSLKQLRGSVVGNGSGGFYNERSEAKRAVAERVDGENA